MEPIRAEEDMQSDAIRRPQTSSELIRARLGCAYERDDGISRNQSQSGAYERDDGRSEPPSVAISRNQSRTSVMMGEASRPVRRRPVRRRRCRCCSRALRCCCRCCCCGCRRRPSDATNCCCYSLPPPSRTRRLERHGARRCCVDLDREGCCRALYRASSAATTRRAGPSSASRCRSSSWPSAPAAAPRSIDPTGGGASSDALAGS